MDANNHGGQGEIALLEEGNHRTKSDLNLIARAVREEWPVAADKRKEVVARVLKNVEEGDIDQSTKAASVLVAMTRVNQADLHHVESMASGDKSKDVSVNVGVVLNVPAPKVIGEA